MTAFSRFWRNRPRAVSHLGCTNTSFPFFTQEVLEMHDSSQLFTKTIRSKYDIYVWSILIKDIVKITEIEQNLYITRLLCWRIVNQVVVHNIFLLFYGNPVEHCPNITLADLQSSAFLGFICFVHLVIFDMRSYQCIYLTITIKTAQPTISLTTSYHETFHAIKVEKTVNFSSFYSVLKIKPYKLYLIFSTKVII